MNSPSASAKRLPATMASPSIHSLRPSRTRNRARNSRSTASGVGEVAHGQAAGVGGRLEHRQHETHHVVEHGGDDAAVDTARRTLKRCTERHLCHRIITVAVAGDGNSHRVRRTRHDTIGVVHHAVTVEWGHLEQPPLHVVDRTRPQRSGLDVGEHVADECSDAVKHVVVDGVTDDRVPQLTQGSGTRDSTWRNGDLTLRRFHNRVDTTPLPVCLIPLAGRRLVSLRSGPCSNGDPEPDHHST